MWATSILRCCPQTFRHVRELNGEILILVGVYLFVLQSGSFLATNSFLSNVLAYGASQKQLIAGFQHNLSSAGYKPRIHGWDGLQGS